MGSGLVLDQQNTDVIVTVRIRLFTNLSFVVNSRHILCVILKNNDVDQHHSFVELDIIDRRVANSDG